MMWRVKNRRVRCCEGRPVRKIRCVCDHLFQTSSDQSFKEMYHSRLWVVRSEVWNLWMTLFSKIQTIKSKYLQKIYRIVCDHNNCRPNLAFVICFMIGREDRWFKSSFTLRVSRVDSNLDQTFWKKSSDDPAVNLSMGKHLMAHS